MTIEELRKKMAEAETEPQSGMDVSGDWEVIHGRHDSLLLEFIDDSEVEAIFNRGTKWYA